MSISIQHIMDNNFIKLPYYVGCTCVLFKSNYSVTPHWRLTRIILTWTPSWKKAQIWGATSSQAFPIVLSRSNSSNVVFAYSRDGKVCVSMISGPRLKGQEIVIKNKHAHTKFLQKPVSWCTRFRRNMSKYKRFAHMYTRNWKNVKSTCVHNTQTFTTFRNSNTHTLTVLLICRYIPFPH